MMNREEVCSLLTRLMDAGGVPWIRQGELIRFRIRQGGMHWEMNCRCRRDEIVLYSRYPFSVRKEEKAWKLCNGINARTARGAMLLPEDCRPVFRTWVDLRDIYGGEERLREALTFAARITARFWGDWETLSLTEPSEP